MRWNKSFWLSLLVVLLAFGLYAASLYQNERERAQSALQIKDETTAPDSVLIRVTIISVNPAARQLTARLGFRFAGKISQDEVTPSVDLKLLVNNVSGRQEFDFPKGERMNRIEAIFPLDGDLDKYPFDRYETTLSFLMTQPAQKNKPKIPDVAQEKPGKTHVLQENQEETPSTESLTVGESALQGNVPVPLSIALVAALPDLQFSGSIARRSGFELTEIGLNLKRPSRLIRISIVVMILMMGLAISVLAAAVKAIAARKTFAFLPLTLAITLIFGLPALRSIQPGIPAVGVFGDYLSFTWAEALVAISAIIFIWIWLLRSTD